MYPIASCTAPPLVSFQFGMPSSHHMLNIVSHHQRPLSALLILNLQKLLRNGQRIMRWEDNYKLYYDNKGCYDIWVVMGGCYDYLLAGYDLGHQMYLD